MIDVDINVIGIDPVENYNKGDLPRIDSIEINGNESIEDINNLVVEEILSVMPLGGYYIYWVKESELQKPWHMITVKRTNEDFDVEIIYNEDR